MSNRFAIALLGCFVVVAAAQLSHGEDKPANSSPTAEGQEVGELIKQLNDDRFVKREKATEALVKLGHKAVPALGKATSDERPEVSERAFKALSNILKKGDATSKAAARKKLGELAKSENTGVAKGAKDILDRPSARLLPPPGGGFFPGGGFGGRIEIRGIGGGVRSWTVGGTDGDKDIEVTEGDRTVKITKNKKGGITVKVTEKKDGKEITKEYKAKDEKELKKNHAEGHKIYKKYAGGGGLGGVIIRGAGGPGRAIELKRIEKLGGAALPDEVRKEIEKELKKALPEGALPPFDIRGAFPGGGFPGDVEKELKKAEAELRKALEDGGLPPEFKKLFERIAEGSIPAGEAKKAEDAKADLDKKVESLRKLLLDEQKDVKKKLEAMKKLEALQTEKLKKIKEQQAELERKLKEAE